MFEALFGSVSYLKLFWGGHVLVTGGATLIQILSGSHWDKTSNHKPSHEKAGLLEFRRRLPAYYTVGFLFTSWTAWNAFGGYCWGSTPNSYLISLFNTFATPVEATVSSTGILLASTMFQFHLFRRLYETLKVSILSRKQVINPIHAVLNFTYYIAACMSLFAEATPFIHQSSCMDMSSLGIKHVVAIALYGIGSYVHHMTHQQLATLRRNRYGHVTHTDYKIPKGSMFNFVSCPHYFGEILVYSSIALAMDMNNTTWMWLLLYVITNQVYLARSTHKFYLTKFEDYPSGRKMLVPYVL